MRRVARGKSRAECEPVWVCRIERDLFGACVVSVTFGRAGTRGRTIRRIVPDDAAADRFLAHALVRRRGSEKRCGADAGGCIGFHGEFGGENKRPGLASSPRIARNAPRLSTH